MTNAPLCWIGKPQCGKMAWCCACNAHGFTPAAVVNSSQPEQDSSPMGHFHTLTYADAHVTSFFEIAHKGSIAYALSEVFGARQSLTFRYPMVEICPNNAHVRPNRIGGKKLLPMIRRYY
jgi:hypothetical protein